MFSCLLKAMRAWDLNCNIPVNILCACNEIPKNQGICWLQGCRNFSKRSRFNDNRLQGSRFSRTNAGLIFR